MEEQYQYTKTKEIFSKEKDLPKLPGVYKFYDEKNKILYIGKAKNLSNISLQRQGFNSTGSPLETLFFKSISTL